MMRTTNTGPDSRPRMTDSDLELITRATVTGVMRVVPRLVQQYIAEQLKGHGDFVVQLDQKFAQLATTSTQTSVTLAEQVAALATSVKRTEQTHDGVPELIAAAVVGRATDADVEALGQTFRAELVGFGDVMKDNAELVNERFAQLGLIVEDVKRASVTEVNTLTAAHVQAFEELRAATSQALNDYAAQLEGVRENINGLAKAVCDSVLIDVHQHARELREEVRTLIAAIPAGPPGTSGTPGRDGAPGRDGYDATFTQPVPYVAGRMFSRGAVVQHAGALWYANTDTDREPGAAMSGFSLIVDGVKPAGIEADDAGFLHLRMDYASGHSERLALGYRPLQYRGIWEESRTYLQNDCLTCDGGLFIAKRETSGARPGSDAGGAFWQLIVKRGKDGRNGLDGKPGADGRSFRFRGKFNAKQDYFPDDVVLIAEALHICTKFAPVKDRAKAYSPTTAPEDWQLFLPSLIVDKGR